MSKRRYLHLDVFSRSPYAGNQLAVFPDAIGLDAVTMKRIAGEMAFSETSFVTPASQPSCDARVRIFTPRAELPMAGHPTIGTAFALAADALIPRGKERVVFELGVGPTAVDLEWRGDQLDFAWMSQKTPVFGTTIEAGDALAAALGVEPGDLHRELFSPQVASSGVPLLFVPMMSRDGVDRAALDRGALREILASTGDDELPVYLFSLEHESGASAYSRMFAPTLGIAEDPATGGACGPLLALLWHHGALGAARDLFLVNRQGVRLGRPSEIHIRATRRDDTIEDLQVGGHALLVAEGELHEGPAIGR